MELNRVKRLGRGRLGALRRFLLRVAPVLLLASPPEPAWAGSSTEVDQPGLPRGVPPEIEEAIEAIGRDDWEHARQLLERVSPQDPAYPLALHNLGLVFQKLGAPDAARDTFRTLTRLTPTAPDAWVELGWASYLLDDVIAAEAATRRALALLPVHPTALYNLALFRLAQGDLDQAVPGYLEAVRADSDQQAIAGAYADVKKLLAVNPGDPGLHYVRALFLGLLGETARETGALHTYLTFADPGPWRNAAEARLKQLQAAAAAPAPATQPRAAISAPPPTSVP